MIASIIIKKKIRVLQGKKNSLISVSGYLQKASHK